MEEDQSTLIDRIGPKTTAGILVALVSAATLGAVALRDLVVASVVDISHLKSRADDHESRLRAQEQRPPRLSSVADDLRECCDGCNNAIAACKERAAVMDERVRHIEAEQGRDRLCARVAQCNSGPRR